MKEALGVISGVQLLSPDLWEPSKVCCFLHWKEGSGLETLGE